jgi:hypothetical protein
VGSPRHRVVVVAVVVAVCVLAVVGQIYAWFVCVKRGGKSENWK